MKSNSSTEAANIACDFVVLLWRRKRLWKPDTSKNYWNTKKQPWRFTKSLPRTSKQYIDNKLECFFLDAYCHIFWIKRTKLWRSEDDVKTTQLTSSLGRARRPRLNRIWNFAGPRHFHVLVDVASCLLKLSNVNIALKGLVAR